MNLLLIIILLICYSAIIGKLIIAVKQKDYSKVKIQLLILGLAVMVTLGILLITPA